MKFWIIAVVVALAVGLGFGRKMERSSAWEDTKQNAIAKDIAGYPAAKLVDGEHFRCAKCGGQFAGIGQRMQYDDEYIWHGQCGECHAEHRWVGDANAHPISISLTTAHSAAPSTVPPTPVATSSPPGNQNSAAPTVVWSKGAGGIYPACPYCRLEVVHDKDLKVCFRCGRDIRWTTAVCPNCHGERKFRCNRCEGSGTIGSSSDPCPYCYGRGTRVCGPCKGDGIVGD